MKLLRLILDGHRSIEWVDFDAGPFTVLFGRNNAGKTNLLETLYGTFESSTDGVIRRTVGDRGSKPQGAMYVELERGLPFDDAVSHAAFGNKQVSPQRLMLTTSGVVTGDPDDYYEEEIGQVYPGNWRDRVSPAPNPHILYLNWQVDSICARAEELLGEIANKSNPRGGRFSPWLENCPGLMYRIPPFTNELVDRLGKLATDLLPDFVDGEIRAYVTSPDLWDRMPKVALDYEQRGLSQCADSIEAAGQGAARWMAVSIQIALHLMRDYPNLVDLRELGTRGFSGHILLLDEPEAHLHPSAVASMVRWCELMTSRGCTVIVASHHGEFLRVPAELVTLVHVTRSPDLVHTNARPVLSSRVSELQQLAADIGMDPASILALHSAIVFVEGTLDEAFLDEYGGLELDAAGVKIVPIQGTKNIEGIVSVEIVTNLGLETAILTDATDPGTMWDRSKNKRSSEERSVTKVIELAASRGLPMPKSFGIKESDILFTIPVEAIRDYLNGPFPEWQELVAECREELGMGPSDSVNWKEYAFEKYNLDIRTPAGVREIVRKLDLADVEIPSIRRVIDEIVAWARSLPLPVVE